MLPFMYYLLDQEPQINLQIGSNDLVFGILTILFSIIGLFFMRYMRQQDKNYEKLEIKVENLDQRMDKFEVGQAKILMHLGID